MDQNYKPLYSWLKSSESNVSTGYYRLQKNLVIVLLGYSVTGLVDCINIMLLSLFSYLVTGLLGYWVTGLLGNWVTGLLGYLFTWLLGYLVSNYLVT